MTNTTTHVHPDVDAAWRVAPVAAPVPVLPDREIFVPAWIAIPGAIAIAAALFLGGMASEHALTPVRTVAHTVTVDQTYTGQQIAACIRVGMCPAHPVSCTVAGGPTCTRDAALDPASAN